MAKFKTLKPLIMDGAVVQPGNEVEFTDKDQIKRLTEKQAIEEVKASSKKSDDK